MPAVFDARSANPAVRGVRFTMELVLDQSGPFTVARVSGELVGSNAESLTETLYDHVSGSAGKLAIDLSALQSIDSSGLSALMNLVTHARLAEGQVVLVAPTRFVAGVFSVTNLDRWFDIVETMDRARDYFANA